MRRGRKSSTAFQRRGAELRDRWLERVNAGQYVFEDAGKYDVSRALPVRTSKPMPVLPAA